MAYPRGYKIYVPTTTTPSPVANPSTDIQVGILYEGAGTDSYTVTNGQGFYTHYYGAWPGSGQSIPWNAVLGTTTSNMTPGAINYRYVVPFDDQNDDAPSIVVGILNLVAPTSAITAVKTNTAVVAIDFVAGATQYLIKSPQINSGAVVTLDPASPLAGDWVNNNKYYHVITDPGINPLSTVSYQVASKSAAGTTGYSTSQNTTTLTALSIPTISGSTVNGYYGITLTLTDPDTFVTSYKYECGSYLATTTYPTKTKQVDVQYGATYSCKVTAIRDVVVDGHTFTDTAVSLSQDITVPAMPSPTGLNATLNFDANTVTMQWSSTDTANSGFRVYHTIDGTESYTDVIGTNNLTAILSIPDGKAMTVYVKGRKNTSLLLLSNQSNSITVVNLKDTDAIGGNPGGPDNIQWRWKPVSGATKYNIYDNGTGTLITTVTDTKYTQTGLTEGTAHTIKIHTVNSSDYESTVGRVSRSVTTLSPPPVPSNFVVDSSTPNTLKFTWTAS